MLKRSFDILISFVSLLLILPIAVIICLLIKISSKGPILFWSKRIGQNNKVFCMPKFRTMASETPIIATHLIKEPERYLTGIGSLLRKFSLDEIPQLLSIFKGDMSIVGPRPALFNQYDLIKLRSSENIHIIKPGLTGLAQVNGRDNLSIEKKVALDKEYLINQSFFLDLKIIFKTIYLVFLGRDIRH